MVTLTTPAPLVATGCPAQRITLKFQDSGALLQRILLYKNSIA